MLISQVTFNPGNSSFITTITALLFVLLGTGGVIAFFKVRPESSRISVEAAQGAVVVQSAVIDDMKKELERHKLENERLSLRLTEIERTSANVDKLQKRVDYLSLERNKLTRRVKSLEKENIKLLNEIEVIRNGNGNNKLI